MIRVVVAEDSPTARGLLVAILAADPEIEVVGEAADGVEAVALTRRLRPNVVTMDIQMPRMDGLQATKQIMTEVPTPVVVVSTLIERDIRTSMDSLRAGALAVLQKLVGPDAPTFDAEAKRLRDTVKAMAEVKVVRHWPPRSPVPDRPRRGPRRAGPSLVTIAASTGGPAALSVILRALPADFPLPILVVQHIAIGFAPGLAEWLGTLCALKVRVAQHGARPRPGEVLIAPDDRHLGLARDGTLEITNEPPVLGFRPSGNYLFSAAARALGPAACAVVLTGMGTDGVEGLRELRAAGGQVVAQDEASSVVFGMPGAAVAAGLADEVLPLSEIAGWLTRAVAAEDTSAR